VNEWPLIGPWSNHTGEPPARREAEQICGESWQTIAGQLRERIDEIDEEASDGC
jgi:hypothetical protein